MAKAIYRSTTTDKGIIAWQEGFDPNIIFREAELIDYVNNDTVISFANKVASQASKFIKHFDLNATDCYLLSYLIKAKKRLAKDGKYYSFLSTEKLLAAAGGGLISRETIRRCKRKLEKLGLLETRNDLNLKRCRKHNNPNFIGKALPNTTTWYHLVARMFPSKEIIQPYALRRGLLRFACKKLKRLGECFNRRNQGADIESVKPIIEKRIRAKIIQARYNKFGRVIKKVASNNPKYNKNYIYQKVSSDLARKNKNLPAKEESSTKQIDSYISPSYNYSYLPDFTAARLARERVMLQQKQQEKQVQRNKGFIPLGSIVGRLKTRMNITSTKAVIADNKLPPTTVATLEQRYETLETKRKAIIAAALRENEFALQESKLALKENKNDT